MTVADWQERFIKWSQGPSPTEKERCENAERMVRDAIRSYAPLRNRSLKVFAQGSYRNRTNVRGDSDVDICVLCTDGFFPDYSHTPGVSNQTLGFSDGSYGFSEFKRDVKGALIDHFGSENLDLSGSKAYNAKENTYRISADVVPTFEGRLYLYDAGNNLTFVSGTVLQDSVTGQRINNWPEQHYESGVAKHVETKRQFKKKARCLKTLSNYMAERGCASAQKMASFLLESLVHNCPVSVFEKATHYDDMKEAIRYLWDATRTDEAAKGLLEVNRIKFLFHPSQPWSRATVNQFLVDAWNFVEFGK